MLLDGRAGEQPSSDDWRSSLREEEFHHLQKLQEIIREDPEKADNLYQKFRDILKEEKREDLICSHCPLMNHRDDWDENQMGESHSHGSGSLKMIYKRDVELRKKVGKKKHVSKKKEIDKKKDPNKHQVLERNAVTTQKRLQNGKVKVKLESRRRNSSKKKSKQVKMGKGRKNLKRRKPEKKEKTTKRLKKTLSERQGKADDIKACLTKVIFYARLNEKKASAISKQVKSKATMIYRTQKGKRKRNSIS